MNPTMNAIRAQLKGAGYGTNAALAISAPL